MFKKIVKIFLIVLGVLVLGFIGLVIYEMTIGLPKSAPETQTVSTSPSPEPITKKTEPPKQVPLPSLPSSSEPAIVSVEPPKQFTLNQKNNVTVNYKDREGDVAKLVFHDLNSGRASELDFSSRAAGKYFGTVIFTQTPKEAIFTVKRLILVDAAGNQSAPYIFTYKAGDTSAYDRFDAEVLMARPVERRKKIHFFILSNSEYKTELANGSSFASEEASIGTASPAVVKMFEASVLPQINGLWDQCGVAFDLGMVKVVRPEKVNVPAEGTTLWEDTTLLFLFGTLIETGEPFVITGDTDNERGISLINEVLPAFGIPNGDIAIFIVGPRFLDINDEHGAVGHAIKNLVLMSWRYVHFQNETRGEIIIPKPIMKILAHEIGHALGLDHPGEGIAVPENKFSEFNLMRQRKLRSELIPEQCEIVKANL